MASTNALIGTETFEQDFSAPHYRHKLVSKVRSRKAHYRTSKNRATYVPFYVPFAHITWPTHIAYERSDGQRYVLLPRSTNKCVLYAAFTD